MIKILLAQYARGLFVRPTLLSRSIASVMVFLFGVNMVLAPLSFAQSANPSDWRDLATSGGVAFLPAAGSMVGMTPKFDPMVVKGIKLYPDNPFKFDFIVDTGDMTLSHEQIKDEGRKLASYFLASLTTPEKEMWVNLSPYEKSRIIPSAFGDTEMGKELLSEDYILKQIMATALYPQRQLGKEFWQRVYAQALREFGTTDVPVSTFNKVWIVPDEAVVWENAQVNSVFVVQSRLRVMLEQDYLAMSKREVNSEWLMVNGQKQNITTINNSPLTINQLGSQIIRDIVIPALTKEVNEGKNFAGLRQVYQSLILAAWYKKNLKDNVLAKGYVDRSKTLGVDTQDKQITEKIYLQYLKAYRKGVYNYIKEELDPATQQMIPRKYFSGGVNYTNMAANLAMASPAQVSAFDASMSASVRRGVLYTLGAVFLAVGLSAGAHAAGFEAPIGKQGPYAAYLQINPNGTHDEYQRELSNGGLQVRLSNRHVVPLRNFNPRMIPGESVLVETATVHQAPSVAGPIGTPTAAPTPQAPPTVASVVTTAPVAVLTEMPVVSLSAPASEAPLMTSPVMSFAPSLAAEALTVQLPTLGAPDVPNFTEALARINQDPWNTQAFFQDPNNLIFQGYADEAKKLMEEIGNIIAQAQAGHMSKAAAGSPPPKKVHGQRVGSFPIALEAELKSTPWFMKVVSDIEGFEAYRAFPYPDPRIAWLILQGYGTSRADWRQFFPVEVLNGRPMTQQEAEDVLIKVLVVDYQRIVKLVGGPLVFGSIPYSAQGVLLALDYQAKDFNKFKLFIAAIIAGRYPEAANRIKNSALYRQTRTRAIREYIEPLLNLAHNNPRKVTVAYNLPNQAMVSPGGIDLEKLMLNTKGAGGVRTAFSDPRILQMLLDAKGLFAQIQSIEPLTVSMVDVLLGFNNQADSKS